jgi:hypothetical protein
MTLQQETARQLKSFLDGEQDAESLEAWILTTEGGEDSSEEESEALLELRLMLLESGEGSRPLEDAKAVAARLLDDAGVLSRRYSSQISTSSNSLTQGRPGFQISIASRIT